MVSPEELKGRLKASQKEREVRGPSRPLAKLAEAENRLAKEREKESTFFGKFTGKVKSASQRVTPTAGAIIDKTAAGAKVAGGALLGAGAAAGAGAVKSFQNAGFIIFLLSSITFAITYLSGVPSWYPYASCFFMILAAVLVYGNRGLMITILFTIYYFVLGAPDPSTLGYSLIPLIVVALLINSLVSRLTGKGSFIGSARDEGAIGLLLVTIFIVDTGMFNALLETIGLSLPMGFEDLLRQIPLWSYFGLFVMVKEEGEKTWLKTVAVLLGLLYLVAVLLSFSAVAQATVGNMLPSPEEAALAKEELLGKKEPLIVSWGKCLGELNSFGECVTKRQKDSEYETICKQLEEVKSGALEIDECVDKQRALALEAAKIQVTGVTDPTIKEPTTAEFVVKDRKPVVYYRQQGEERTDPYYIDLEIKNPRKQDFVVEVSCKFVKEGSKRNETLGVIVGPAQLSIDSSERPAYSIICKPLLPLDGRYKLTYEAKLVNLKTVSRLHRALVLREIKDNDEKMVLFEKIMRAHFPGQSYLSQAPADFARINFALGNPLENPIIEPGKNLVLSSAIENSGKGRIDRIRRYHIGLEEFSVDDYSCLEGFEMEVPQGISALKKTVHLPTCFVQGIPAGFDTGQEYIFREYLAELEYDYVIDRTVQVEVAVLAQEPIEAE